MSKIKQGDIRAGILLLLLAFIFSSFVLADPTGGIISNAVTETAANVTPGSRTDARGTITTMVLTAVQQDQHWKGYVGNISGSLTLDDAANFTIYDWDLTSITGQVYSSRNGTLDWTSVSCADVPDITTESVFNNMSDTDVDRINATFNWTIHQAFDVGVTNIGANSCPSTVTYANDTRQVPTTGAPFQELLIEDANQQFIYMTKIDDNTQGFDNQSYDFQMIVAESDVKPSATAYYFYVELR